MKLFTCESARSRAATASLPAPGCWARRCSRTSGEAVSNILTSAPGATTVVISRPSATIPRPEAWAAWMICRWRAIICSRTPGTALTWLTALFTSSPCRNRVTSRPSIKIRGAWATASTCIGIVVASAVSAAGSFRSACFCRAYQVRARYMAPVFKKLVPSSAADRRAMVDLPAPLGPSMAITKPAPRICWLTYCEPSPDIAL